jgi:hypothetical protein
MGAKAPYDYAKYKIRGSSLGDEVRTATFPLDSVSSNSYTPQAPIMM